MVFRDKNNFLALDFMNVNDANIIEKLLGDKGIAYVIVFESPLSDVYTIMLFFFSAVLSLAPPPVN